MKITLAKNPQFFEQCQAEGLHPNGYFFPPDRFVEPETEGRLIEILRSGAQIATENTLTALTNAVFAYLEDDQELAFALADLTVTGRNAYRLFSDAAVSDEALSAALQATGVEISTTLTAAVSAVLDRAYASLLVIRHRIGERNMGWIAVWAEVDPPHRPINVPGTNHTHYDIEVPVRRNGDAPAQTILSRFAIFDEFNLPAETDVELLVRNRQLPPAAVPSIQEGSRYLIYMHGHSSRLEEGEKLGASLRSNSPYTLISMDLPCNGYASMFDHTEIAQDNDTNSLESFPLLDLIEQYVIDFVRAIGRMTDRTIENQTVAVVGGSLGGNLALRLARRRISDNPWLNNFVAWSAASVWTPYTDILREAGPNTARTRMKERDFPERRSEYIRQVFDDSVRVLGVKPQGEYWYRDEGWEPCKTLYLKGAREDRREIYNESFRRWHWRVALEQMLFSHRVPISRLEKIQGRLLLMTAEGDDYPWTHIHDSTRDMAYRMGTTPGSLRLLKNTGHSIHDERPLQLAYEIGRFLPDEMPPENEERWTAWASLGAATTTAPVVGMQEDGRLSLFITTIENKVFCNTQSRTNSAWGSVWNEIRGGIDTHDRFGTSLAVDRNWDGRLEVFCQYANESWATHVWQHAPNGGWHDWDKGNQISQLIGGATDSVFSVERFGEAPGEISEDGLRFDVGRRWLLVGCIRTNGRVHIRGQNAFGWWTYGRDLGEESIRLTGIPFATRLVSGLLIIFARDSSGRLLFIKEIEPDTWQSTWQQVEGIATSTDVTAALDADGLLRAAVRTHAGQLVIVGQTAPSGNFDHQELMEGILADSKPIILRNAWGEMQVFVRWDDGTIRSARQHLGPARAWTPWTNLGGSAMAGPSAYLSYNGTPQVFHIGTDRAVYVSTPVNDAIRIVTSIIRDDSGITHLCNELEPWSPIAVSEVIDQIRGNDREYYTVSPGGARNRIIVRQILTTRADGLAENNLGSLPRFVITSFTEPEEIPPGIADSKRVTHTVRDSDHPFASVTGLYNADEGWTIRLHRAIEQITAGTQHYHIEEDSGVRNEIIARVFLTTAADGVAANNLGELPEH